MSDGEENMKPKLNDVLPELMAAKVGVSTMAMGASADYQIEKLATMTDGKAFFFPDFHRNTAILMQIAFEESTNREDSVYIRIANFAKSFTTNLEEKFILESSLGNNTVVIFDQLNPSLTDVSVTLIDPSGQECKMCVQQGGKKTKRILIPSPAQDGEWTIRLESASLQEVEVNIQVKSQARDPNDKPIRVKSEMAVLQVAKPDDAVILTEINKGYKVILDARVVAEVIGPNSPHKSTVPLYDDGLG
ncbi:calcium-activated chloride channel regulator 1-like [Rhipicephalus microplus]|uniref:calcium-activated chloride channel regulator 1-like n=1 Tax=Rhipicephalus microplus TaxID=6941 RepID=UPI003F6A67AF